MAAAFCIRGRGKLEHGERLPGDIFSLNGGLLPLKVKAKPEEPPPSRRDSEVHVSVAVGVSAGPDFPALGVAAAVFVLG